MSKKLTEIADIKGGKVCVNITTSVNSSAIRHEKRDGRDVIIVPSATLPDNVVMNNIKYPAEVIAKSFGTLERSYAPLGHPMHNGKYISAVEPEAINAYHIGAHNENVRRENGRVFLDKVIDVEVANRTPAGKSLIDAINAGNPIETSTGVFLDLDESSDPAYKYIAKNMYFDHDAILMNEEGAARPSQGVGMMVNSKGAQPQEVTVINSYLDCYENDVEWSVKNLFDAINRLDQAKRSQGFVDKIMSFLGIKSDDVSPEASGLANNHDNEENDMSKEQIDALAEQVKTLETNAQNVKADIAAAVKEAMQPLLDQVTQIQTNAATLEANERKELTDKIVAKGFLEAGDCESMAINALRKLAEKASGKAAPMVAGGFGVNSDVAKDYVDDVDMNLAINEAEKAGK